jgi:hypothetical protein
MVEYELQNCGSMLKLLIERRTSSWPSFSRASALAIFLLFDLAVIVLLFAMIFRYLPDAIPWHSKQLEPGLLDPFLQIGDIRRLI